MANQQEKQHAKEMLAKYLPTDMSRIFGRVVGHISSRGNSTSHRHDVYVIDRDSMYAPTQGPHEWIFHINLYVANLLGYRLDKCSNIVTRDTLQDIVTKLEMALGHKIKLWSL